MGCLPYRKQGELRTSTLRKGGSVSVVLVVEVGGKGRRSGLEVRMGYKLRSIKYTDGWGERSRTGTRRCLRRGSAGGLKTGAAEKRR